MSQPSGDVNEWAPETACVELSEVDSTMSSGAFVPVLPFAPMVMCHFPCRFGNNSMVKRPFHKGKTLFYTEIDFMDKWVFCPYEIYISRKSCYSRTASKNGDFTVRRERAELYLRGCAGNRRRSHPTSSRPTHWSRRQSWANPTRDMTEWCSGTSILQ
jgi:hypothetical protein